VDATCPRVKASQLAARDLAEKGYRIFLAGERDHGEVKGIYGYAAGIEGVCVIVGNPEEAASAARSLRERGDGKTALIGQSTISRDEYLSIAEEIQRIFPHLEVKETICGATRDRQDALRELCARVDAVIVAGGKASANTRRLLAIAGQCGKPCLLAESAADLPEGLDRYPSVGLCAGASTPDSVIAGIEEKLRAL
jgi:4-hydroxy-3-methylbut-2-enyl diphosphate reductase